MQLRALARECTQVHATAGQVRYQRRDVLTKPVWVPALLLVIELAGAGCLDDADNGADANAMCDAPDAYTPYPDRGYASGDVIALPWRGDSSAYPNGREGFDVYAAESTIECGSNKGKRSHLDVTAGCLKAAATADGYKHRAYVELTDETHAFRALALGHVNGELVKWFDQRTEYRFYYSGETDGAFPGFKVFARYRTEDDLYVASWRMDGVVQIQKKQCGEYTALARLEGQELPSRRAWHEVRFEAIGTNLAFYIDDKLAISADDATFSWGTVGIRIDGMTGTYLDDWRVF
ncbi:MAG TPA: hypothetical protein VIV40_24145 [Kofleriaceae bacterium]